ncbi:hypothetical protein FRC04_007396 [Tulasnella sp. 424]|nr:hypothetical protein FRC04_007396 [Tulasnella sp. 424]KAG8962688.1 hypothetical protein FRC05_005144 [Tulasnella sp. 425]
MDHPPFDDKATENTIDQSHMRKSPIDTLPTELLERVIGLGATSGKGWRPEIKLICEWRRVCWRWASVIDHCSALWSFVVVPASGTGHVRTQLEKSKEAPLIVEVSCLGDREEWIRLLVDNANRWKAITWYSPRWREMSAMRDSPPPMLEALAIVRTIIPPDSKFFNPPSPNLRSLQLMDVTIPSNTQPIFGLEELRLTRIQTLEDGRVAPMSVRKFHQFLQASPGLQVLKLDGAYSASAADKTLQPVDLPNLEELMVVHVSILHLFQAEHCASLDVSLGSLQERLPPAAWTTVIPTLRRAKGLEMEVSNHTLQIDCLRKPSTIHLYLHFKSQQGAADLTYSTLEEILQELENESCFSARAQLSLYADEDIGVKVLKLLQSPMPGPSSGWRLPHLDTVCIRREGFPYQHLKAFVQARANAQGDQAPKAVTSILESRSFSSEREEILAKVMDYAGDEGVAEGAVVQAG